MKIKFQNLLLLIISVLIVSCSKNKQEQKKSEYDRPTIQQSKDYISNTISSISEFTYSENVNEWRITDSQIQFNGNNVIYSHNQIQTKYPEPYSDPFEVNLAYKFDINDIDGVSRDHNHGILISLNKKIINVVTPLNGSTFLGQPNPKEMPSKEIALKCPQNKQTELLNAFDNIYNLVKKQNGSDFFKDSIR